MASIGNSLVSEIIRHARNAYKYLIIIALVVMTVACATQPEQSRIVRGDDSEQAYQHGDAHSGDTTAPSASERYKTRSANVPPAVLALLGEAELAITNEHYLRAEHQLSKAQRLAPSASKTYLLWGRLYQAKGNKIHAEQMYKRALSLATDAQQTQLAETALGELLSE